MASSEERASRPGRGPVRRLAGDRGFVTAEAAVVLPVLIAFTSALVWALMAVSAQIQCVDAARAGARAAARQDPPGTVTTVARQTAPDGAQVTVRREGDLVRVRVTAKPPGPDALALDLGHEAVALAEQTVGSGG
ncbi:TadE family type IV pilus minor pilin [Streptomyces vastus]|uniref:TadE family type IV pilus minor pilin n=1 Tax=Streptomyces vastus TaxID=285451 RepID=A0ABN3QXZ4_9ACTN